MNPYVKERRSRLSLVRSPSFHVGLISFRDTIGLGIGIDIACRRKVDHQCMQTLR